MKTIGVISDTHGKLDRRVLDLFEGVDYILHAGDVGREEILIDLAALAPLSAVIGNVDEGGELRHLPQELTVDLGSAKVLLRHGHRIAVPEQRISSVLGRLPKPDIRAAVVGHSHRPYLASHGGILFMNPGSASQPRYGFPATVGMLFLEQGNMRGEIIDLEGHPVEPGDAI